MAILSRLTQPAEHPSAGINQKASVAMTDLNFTSLLCSRLCHDLVSPVGAVANGIELMEMEDDPSMAQDALDLLKHSAENATRKLTYLRMAFGSSGGNEMPLPIDDARAAAMNYFADHRLKLIWPDTGESGVSKARIRLVMNLMLGAAGGLARGGDLNVEVSDDMFAAVGVHERAGLAENIVDALTGRTEAETGEDARIIECFLAHMLAREAGITLTVEQSAGQFAIRG